MPRTPLPYTVPRDLTSHPTMCGFYGCERGARSDAITGAFSNTADTDPRTAPMRHDLRVTCFDRLRIVQISDSLAGARGLARVSRAGILNLGAARMPGRKSRTVGLIFRYLLKFPRPWYVSNGDRVAHRHEIWKRRGLLVLIRGKHSHPEDC